MIVAHFGWSPELEAGPAAVAAAAGLEAELALTLSASLTLKGLATGGTRRALGMGLGVSPRTLVKNPYKACLLKASTGRILVIMSDVSFLKFLSEP
jgi:hypothetical protein